ncbi:E3 ubiquitin-protein ligase ATL4 [Ananas comosus]|uniref:E3 ubiquitin-protein ligase ATL4 n=1 Tax=Ananas comosus TaxID=4615 RepID=A0A199UMG3_ANACO|nr:E3 ubiquitin-protein ligase ATL4 [Ananas comosus]
MAYSPPPPPPLQTLAPPLQTTTLGAASSASAPSSLTLSPSVLIILAILAIVFLASVAIHLFLRFLSRSPASFLRRGSRNHHHHRAAAAASAGGGEAKEVSEGEKATLIERLPLFTLASALSALPKSSPDCAVCQEPFRPDDELRLLPACRHAFHSRCVDPWLRSTLLCPLCRSSIALPFPPLILPPLPPTTAAATAAAAAAAPRMIDDDDDDDDAAPRSGSFRIEMGTVSRRRTAPEDVPGAPSPSPSPHTMRSYAMESYDYVVEEEVEAVISAIPPRRAEGAAAAKEEKPAEGSGRLRVKDRLERFTASASSSFNSVRHSGRWSSRWSNRYDDGGGWREASWWDLEGSLQAREGDDGGGGGGLYAFYRWITGV